MCARVHTCVRMCVCVLLPAPLRSIIEYAHGTAVDGVAVAVKFTCARAHTGGTSVGGKQQQVAGAGSKWRAPPPSPNLRGNGGGVTAAAAAAVTIATAGVYACVCACTRVCLRARDRAHAHACRHTVDIQGFHVAAAEGRLSDVVAALDANVPVDAPAQIGACARVRGCERARVCVCVRVCVRACVCVRAYPQAPARLRKDRVTA